MPASRSKFNERFHMNASATSTRIFYFFAPNHPLENVAVSLMVKRQKVLLSVTYVPLDLQGAIDHRGIIEFKELVQDPEMAGLSLMRLARKVLGHVKT
jgi:hypothetical protein